MHAQCYWLIIQYLHVAMFSNAGCLQCQTVFPLRKVYVLPFKNRSPPQERGPHVQTCLLYFYIIYGYGLETHESN